MDNQEQDITDPFLAIETALARLNENTYHSQNTHSQESEQPEVINNNDPLELLNLALARLAPSESAFQNNSLSLGVDQDEIQTESDEAHSQMSLTQNISSSDPFLAINRTLEALAQTHNEVQIPPELLSQINRLNQNRFADDQSQHSLVSSPDICANDPLNPVSNEQPFQQGGNPENTGSGNSPEPSLIVRNKFNNVEIRQILNFPPPNDIPDYAHYYQGVMASAREISNSVSAHTRPGDLLQIELRGPQLQNNVSVILRHNRDLSEFENLFLRAVQSNWAVMCDGSLELVAQIVRPPAGSGKRM